MPDELYSPVVEASPTFYESRLSNHGVAVARVIEHSSKAYASQIDGTRIFIVENVMLPAFNGGDFRIIEVHHGVVTDWLLISGDDEQTNFHGFIRAYGDEKERYLRDPATWPFGSQ